MSRFSPVPMFDRALPSEFSIGPLQFTNADSFPLEEMYCNVAEDNITLRLSAHHSSDSPWRGDSMVVFFLFRFSDSADAFSEEVLGYSKDAKKSVKLPEKQVFDQSVFALADVTGDWERECFANSGRNLFQVYRSGNTGVMIRWFSQKGTMLDHPLLTLVRDNVKLVDGQWESEAPSTVQVGSEQTEVDDDADEIDLVCHLDLRIEQQKIRRFIEERVSDYPQRENFGPGEPGDPVGLITVGFHAEQTGYVAVVFDTRPEAEVDGGWTTFIEDDLNLLYVPEWYGLYMAVCEEQTVTIIGHDGSEHAITDNDISDEDLNSLFGEMITAVMLEMRNDGTFEKLPQQPEAYAVIEEFDGRYFWPTYETRKTQGAIRV